MKAFTQQEVLNAYDRLPEPVKDAIFEEATADKIQAIGKKHGLLLDRIGVLAEDVGYVMLGLIPTKEFPAYVMGACGVTAQKAGEIIEDLNKDVFLPIRDHIFTVAKTPTPPVKKEVAHSVEDAGPSPVFRQSSFAMPMQGALMIFPQKIREEEMPPPQSQPRIAPKAPEFRETVSVPAQNKPAPLPTNDPYREPIQ